MRRQFSGWRGEAGGDDGRQPADEQQHHRRLQAGGDGQPEDVGDGEHDDDGGCPERRRMRAEIDDARHVVTEDVGEQGDRAGIDHHRLRPCVEEGEALAPGAAEEVVLAAGMRMCRAQFGVAQRAGQPGGDQPDVVLGDAGDHGRCFEDAGTDDDGDRSRRVQQGAGVVGAGGHGRQACRIR